jgi:hypothetical protein
MPLDYYYLGDVKNVETETCLDTMGRRTGENVGISYCHGLGGNQVCDCAKIYINGTLRPYLFPRMVNGISRKIRTSFLFEIWFT